MQINKTLMAAVRAARPARPNYLALGLLFLAGGL